MWSLLAVVGLALATDPALSPPPRTMQLTPTAQAMPEGPWSWTALPGLSAAERTVLDGLDTTWTATQQHAFVQFQPPVDPLPPQGYRMQWKPTGITIESSDDAGLRYALDTVSQVRKRSQLPTGRIEDAPALQERWIHVQLPGRSTGGDPVFPRQQERLATVAALSGTADYLPLLRELGEDAIQSRLNGVVIDLNAMWRFPSHPELAFSWAAPLDTLTPWIDELREHGVIVYPTLPLFSHQENLLAPLYPKLLMVPIQTFPKKRGQPPEPIFWWNPIYDPRSPVVRELVRDLLTDVMNVFDAPMIHIGHDEAGALRFVPAAQDPVGAFVESIRYARECVLERGRQVGIWADMLLDHRRIPGTAHGNESGVQTWRAIDQIPDDVVLFDWQYHGSAAPWPESGILQDVPSLRYLATTGHPVMGAALGKPVAHPDDARRYGRQVEQSALIARTLTELATAHPGRIAGQVTNQFGWTPGRNRAWAATSVAGVAHIAGLHGWTGGETIWPPID
ncbi:MAG: hypothetical protein CL927_07300 [Deltaproteobacteria bacterium]|nr:hypothetical protein [Deltaproteobacteria bacterium]HCH63366.1 hypothetical protein [Deltaproteobacteria bacterium]